MKRALPTPTALSKPAGSALVFSTYLGGSGDEGPGNLSLDSATGDIYVVGSTPSLNFPILNAFQPVFGGGAHDAFVSKFSSAGGLLYSSFLGGNGDDGAGAIAVNATGVYVAGSTNSTNLATSGVFQSSLASDPDGFVTKISETSSAPAISPPVSPNSGTQGQTIPNFTVNGGNFDPNATLSFGGTGVTVNSYSSRTATQIVASITIAKNAPTGPQAVTITNPDGQQGSLLGAFTIFAVSPPTGALFVFSNLPAARFMADGSAIFSGAGNISFFPTLPSGTYKLTFADVQGFISPPQQNFDIRASSTSTVIGNYRRLIFAAFPGLGTSATSPTSGMATLVCEITGALPSNPAGCSLSAGIVTGTVGNTFAWNSPAQGSGSAADFIASQVTSGEDVVGLVGHSYGGNTARVLSFSAFTPTDILVTIDPIDPNICRSDILSKYLNYLTCI